MIHKVKYIYNRTKYVTYSNQNKKISPNPWNTFYPMFLPESTRNPKPNYKAHARSFHDPKQQMKTKTQSHVGDNFKDCNTLKWRQKV